MCHRQFTYILLLNSEDGTADLQDMSGIECEGQHDASHVAVQNLQEEEKGDNDSFQ